MPEEEEQEEEEEEQEDVQGVEGRPVHKKWPPVPAKLVNAEIRAGLQEQRFASKVDKQTGRRLFPEKVTPLLHLE